MHYILLNRKFESVHPLKHDYKMLGFKEVTTGGVIHRESCVERIETAKSLNSYHVSDFKLENIIAVGAFDMLKPQTLTDTNPLSVVNDFEQRISENLKGIEK